MTRSQPKVHVPNPAAWIGRIWDRMPAASGEASLRAWGQAFGLKEQDPRVFEAVGCFLDMGKKTEEAVTALRGLPDKVRSSLLGWTGAFDEVVHNTAVNGAWANIRIRFTDVRREQLRQCEEWLDEQMWTAQETRAYLASLLSDIDAMRTTVQGADLEDEFRRLLLDILEALRRAVVEYDIRGSRGVFSSLGEVLALRARYTVPKDASEADRGLWEKTWGLVKKVSVVSSTAAGLTKAYEIGHDVYGFLSGP